MIKKRLFGYSVSDTDILLATLREENSSLSSTVAALRSQLTQDDSQQAGEMEKLRTDFSALEEKAARKDEEMAKLTQEFEALRDERDKLSAVRSEADDRASQLEQTLRQKSDEAVRAETELAEIRDELEKLRTDNAALKEKSANAPQDDTALAESRAEIERLNGEIAELKQQSDAASKAEIERLNGEITEIKAQSEIMQQSDVASKAEIERLNGVIAELKDDAELEQMQKDEDTEKSSAELAAAKAEVEKLSGEIAEIKAQDEAALAASKAEVEKLNGEITEIKAQAEIMQQSDAASKAEIERLNGVIAELKDDAELERMQKDEDAEKSSAELASAKAEVEKLSGEIAEIKAKAETMQQSDAASKAEIERLNGVIAELKDDAELERMQKDEDAEKSSAELASAKAEVEKLNGEIAELKQQNEAALAEAKAEAEKLNGEIAEIKAQDEAALAEAKAEVEKLNGEIAEIKEQAELDRAHGMEIAGKYKSDLAAARTEAETLSVETMELRERIALARQSEDALAMSRAETERLKGENAALELKAEQLELAFFQRDEDAQNALEELAACREENENLRSGEERASGELEALRGRLEEKIREAEQLTARLSMMTAAAGRRARESYDDAMPSGVEIQFDLSRLKEQDRNMENMNLDNPETRRQPSIVSPAQGGYAAGDGEKSAAGKSVVSTAEASRSSKMEFVVETTNTVYSERRTQTENVRQSMQPANAGLGIHIPEGADSDERFSELYRWLAYQDEAVRRLNAQLQDAREEIDLLTQQTQRLVKRSGL